MRKRRMVRHILGHILGLCGVFLFGILCFAVAYGTTSFFYQMLGKHPHDFIQQLINSVFSSFIFFATMLIIGNMMIPKRMALFNVMIEAMKRIAKGDFNVNLEVDERYRGPFGQVLESLNEMAVELSHMEQMRQEFISNVSHELQSPLTSISGFAKVLQKEELSPEVRKNYLSIIETESIRLSKICENLLKLTSLESEHHPFEPKRYRLDKQIRNIILACEPHWLEKELEMDISLEEVNIVADEDLMSQVWVNLIHNSIKFTPNGGTISIYLEQSENQAIATVKDTGIGIAEEDQPHIFERFYKADKSRNRTSGGSGLGLSIVKKIIDMHKGSVRVQSKLGKGSSFIVKIPIIDYPDHHSHRLMVDAQK